MTQLLKEKQTDYRFNRHLIDECEGKEVHTTYMAYYNSLVNTAVTYYIVVRHLKVVWPPILPVMDL